MLRNLKVMFILKPDLVCILIFVKYSAKKLQSENIVLKLRLE